MSALRRAARFWWGFIIGDDWHTAAGLAFAFGLCAVLAHESIATWWLLPVAAITLLAMSLYRVTKRLRD